MHAHKQRTSPHDPTRKERSINNSEAKLENKPMKSHIKSSLFYIYHEFTYLQVKHAASNALHAD
jgi:hypothetical protein